ncbi:MAG TPA: DUF3465 domain-containing protein [Candidatus Ozemobacteraceae bacterium]|nr:DUF3465 domain-containing protein [Candidatus Ozemobacteraceae bacterium]
MSKQMPELTWQDKAILVTIPVVVLAIFVFANYIGQDTTISDAFQQKMPKVVVRDAGLITALIPPDPVATDTQKCRLRSRDGQTEFTFVHHVQGSATMPLAIGRQVQFYGEYRYDPQGGFVDVPFKGKSGRLSGWAVYENKRYFSTEDDPL